MPSASRVARALCLCLALLTLNSCLVRHRLITRQGKPGKQSKQTLIVATKEDLEQHIRARYDSFESFSATVDMTPSVGSVYKGEITEYKDILGYILFRKPDEVRIIGKYPLVRSTAFDMASDGKEFRIYLPSKNRFLEGSNEAPATSPNKLENLRPEAFASSLVIRPVDEKTEFSVLLDFTDEDNAIYFLVIMQRTSQGDPRALRSIWFDRLSLRIVRQETFDAKGLITSDTRYSEWQSYSGVPFPKKIDINRPEDGYGVVMEVTKLDMNPPLTDDKFMLKQPEGTQRQVLGAALDGSSSKPRTAQ